MSEPVLLSVIAPCFNEAGNVPLLAERVVATFDRMGVEAELILIDDGSRDGTWRAIEEASAKEPRVRGERHAKNRGIVGGWLTGLAISRGELLCLIDSDLQNRPEDIAELFQAHRRDGVDLIQAVRHPKSGMRRMAFSRALNHILNLSFGMHLRDNKSGFILCRREVLQDILKDAEGFRYFQSLIGVAAGARGLTISEVDTVFDARHAGESFLSSFPIMVSLRVIGELLRYRIATLRRPR